MEWENNLVLGDMLKILPKIPNDTFDLIIIDPPYNLKKDFPNDNINPKKFKILLEKWISIIVPKLKPNGSFYVFNSDKYVPFLKSLIDTILIYKNTLIWNYNYRFGDNSKKNYSNRREFILYYTKSNNHIFNQIREEPSINTIKKWKNKANKLGNIPYENLTPSMKKERAKKSYDKKPINIYKGSIIGNVFKIPRVSRWKNKEFEYGKHPTQKPEKLIETFIKVSSNEGDLVGDFFAGSGTTLVVAKKLRRKYFGCEIEPKYYEIAKKRLESRINQVNISKSGVSYWLSNKGVGK